jgi:hypothetical protein
MQKHSYFISAAYGEDLLVLQGVLDRLQVTWDWGAFTSIDQPILTSVVDAVKKADFIIGVLHDRKLPANVFLSEARTIA